MDLQTDSMQNAVMEKHERLRSARSRHFGTAKQAAVALGVPYGTYSGHEAGNRGVKDFELSLYARRFRVRLAWLAFGDGSPDLPKVPIVGTIGADARPDVVTFVEAGSQAFDYGAPLPPAYSEATRALEVRGQFMRNLAKDGWLIYYDSDDVEEPPTDRLIGELCICWLEDTTVLLKELQPGMGSGFFDLESANAPTVRDVVIRRAAKVTAIVPSGRRPQADRALPAHRSRKAGALA